MTTEIRGGSNQVGTSNTQFIESPVTTNNNNFNIINVNCYECHQHQQLDGVSVSQGNIHHVMDCLQKIATSGDELAQPKVEAAIKGQIEPASQEQQQEVKKRKRKITGLSQQTSSPEKKKAVSDSVRILDLHGHMLEPGDIVLNQGSSIYVGDGSVVRYDRSLNIVVKEKLQMARVFVKGNPLSHGNLNEFLPEQRVQRALQQVGRPCPVQGGSHTDFVYWIFTGLSFEESSKRKFSQKKDFGSSALSALGWLTGKKL